MVLFLLYAVLFWELLCLDAGVDDGILQVHMYCAGSVIVGIAAISHNSGSVFALIQPLEEGQPFAKSLNESTRYKRSEKIKEVARVPGTQTSIMMPAPFVPRWLVKRHFKSLSWLL